MDKYNVIGLMSGTSLDGLDIAFCQFSRSKNGWRYHIVAAETQPYSITWKNRLMEAGSGSGLDLTATDVEYGHFSGELARSFIEKHKLSPDFIASHGHTVFHRPDRKITCQIGRGSAIAAETQLPVVCDFRSLDVALGGQGAPLVPIGDELLFGDYDYCLNLGGFANVSFREVNERKAFDVCPANIILNHLSARAGADYDAGGKMASGGRVKPELLENLDQLPYYKQNFPKSLGKEWVVEQALPVINRYDLPVNDLLATVCEHIARQVAFAAGTSHNARMLITGGGAFNDHLVERIRHHASPGIVIPDPLTVNFKEALIFAFLGVLRWRNEINCLGSVTGAVKDSSGGAIY